MRGGLDAGTIARQCSSVLSSKKDKIQTLAKTNDISLTSASDFVNPCPVIVPRLVDKNVINDNNANTFFKNL